VEGQLPDEPGAEPDEGPDEPGAEPDEGPDEPGAEPDEGPDEPGAEPDDGPDEPGAEPDEGPDEPGAEPDEGPDEPGAEPDEGPDAVLRRGASRVPPTARTFGLRPSVAPCALQLRLRRRRALLARRVQPRPMREPGLGSRSAVPPSSRGREVRQVDVVVDPPGLRASGPTPGTQGHRQADPPPPAWRASGPNCQSCDNNGCMACNPSHFSYYYSPFQRSVCIPDCAPGYRQPYMGWESPACVACPSNCLACTPGSGQGGCTSCESGYYVDSSGYCQQLPTGCASMGSSGCDTCQTGYYMDIGTCRPIPAGCASYDGASCTDCQSGWFLEGGQCVTRCIYGDTCGDALTRKCISVPSNAFSDAAGTCQCQSGYYRYVTADQNFTCDPCSPGCTTCDNRETCTGCPDGYYLSSGSCVFGGGSGCSGNCDGDSCGCGGTLSGGVCQGSTCDGESCGYCGTYSGGSCADSCADGSSCGYCGAYSGGSCNDACANGVSCGPCGGTYSGGVCVGGYDCLLVDEACGCHAGQNMYVANGDGTVTCSDTSGGSAPGCWFVLVPSTSVTSNMAAVRLTTAHYLNLHGTSSDTHWNELRAICESEGFLAPTTSSSSAYGNWSSSTNQGWPVTSDQWPLPWPWLSGSFPDGFPGGRLWMPGGEPGWLSVAYYYIVSPGSPVISQDPKWFSYHPSTGQGTQLTGTQTLQAGDFILCAMP
jgi:hypothetical protein